MDHSFQIAVDIGLSEDELLQLLSKTIAGATRNRGYVEIAENVIKFENNPDFDNRLSYDSESGWEFYRFDCDVIPIEDTSTETQVRLAQELVRVLRDVGARAIVLAEFDIPGE